MEFVDKIYIISLDRHKIRKQTRLADLDSAGFDTSKIEWINAIDGGELDINQCIKDGTIDSTFKDPCGVLTKSVYGCAMSHKIAYERFLNTSDDVKTALVLEDDASITHTFLRLLLTESFGYLSLLDELERINWDVIMLGGQEKRVEHIQGLTYVLKPVKRYPMTYAAHSYMLTKNGAQKLLDSNKSIQFAADVNLYSADVNLYCTPSNFFEQKVGTIDKFTMSSITSNIKQTILNYDDIGNEVLSATTYGDWDGDEETKIIATTVSVSKKINLDSVDWKPFKLPNGDVIEDWANIHLKIDNE